MGIGVRRETLQTKVFFKICIPMASIISTSESELKSARLPRVTGYWNKFASAPAFVAHEKRTFPPAACA